MPCMTTLSKFVPRPNEETVPPHSLRSRSISAKIFSGSEGPLSAAGRDVSVLANRSHSSSKHIRQTVAHEEHATHTLHGVRRGRRQQFSSCRQRTPTTVSQGSQTARLPARTVTNRVEHRRTPRCIHLIDHLA